MRSETEMIAYALEIDPQLLPFAPALLADLDELGSDAEMVVEVLRTLNLPPSTRVIDLGCGKGAVAIEIAAELGWQVLGVDLFEPFIKDCRAQAELAGVGHLCSFICGDILQLAGEFDPYDVVIFGALGDTLGSFEETIGIIRKYVRPGGYLVISDDYLKDGGSKDFARLENYASHDETLRRLTSFGDVLIREFPEPTEAEDAEDEDSDLIQQRAEALAEQHPEMANTLYEFVANQRSEVRFLRENFVPVVWLLQRT